PEPPDEDEPEAPELPELVLPELLPAPELPLLLMPLELAPGFLADASPSPGSPDENDPHARAASETATPPGMTKRIVFIVTSPAASIVDRDWRFSASAADSLSQRETPDR
ncbi:MAG: hypothetical protein M3O46_15630, partial [Myxococcota bacterium]|nr:hypothetical protein [Myxococcota bacterium]